ncbi:putative reverse transcriptase domain-containing protein, partial [Tanacetum coccineum]
GEAIPFGRPYDTHLNGPRKFLTARKRVRPFSACRLAWRRISHHSSDRHSSPDSPFSSSSSDSSSDTSSGSSSDSLSDSSSVHSSGCDSSGQAYSGPSTRDVSPMLVYPPVLNPRHSKAFRCWRAAPLSTPYPPTTSESSLGSSSDRSLDSSSSSSGPSRKRCRSSTASVPSSTHVSRLIAPTPADLLPPYKRFKDSYSLEDNGEEHMEVGTANAETIVDLDISDRVGALTEDGLGIRVEIVASNVREDEEEFEAEASEASTREITIDPLATRDISESTRGDVLDHDTTDGAVIESVQRFQGHRIARVDLGVTTMTERLSALEQDNARLRDTLRRERVGLSDRIMSLRLEYLKVRRDRDDARRRLRRTMTITRSGMTPEAIKELINRYVEEALAAYEEARAANALEAESQSQNGSDGDNRHGGNRNGGNGNGGNGDGGNGNGGNGNGRNENPNENGRGDRLVARECTYQDFMKCQPLTFKETEGVVVLTRWFEKMETVFHISNCPEKYQVKYATCTLLNIALTWWNSHKRTVGTDAAFAMSWRELMKLMAEVYCPRNEIQKMESKLWNLTVKNNDLAAYNQRFQELTMLCTKMVPEEEDQVKRYIGGLLDNI